MSRAREQIASEWNSFCAACCVPGAAEDSDLKCSYLAGVMIGLKLAHRAIADPNLEQREATLHGLVQETSVVGCALADAIKKTEAA
jgi:hypothetical protein